MKFADQRSARRRRVTSYNSSPAERDRRHKLARRKMLLESLENRSLLATIDLVVNLYADNGGVPGALIANDTVTPDQEFWVEITAKDTSAVPSGLIGLALDVGFDPAAFDEIDTPFDPTTSTTIITPDFPLFRDGTLDNNAGTIDELSGASLPNLGQGDEIGEATHDRFALLKFKANATVANSPFTIAIGKGSAAFADGSSLENATIEAQTITVADTAQTPTLTIDDITANEGSDGTTTSFTFTVTLSPASTGTVLVQVDTKDVTAIAPGDYETVTGQVLTFNAGETTKTVTVKVVADKLSEPIETFQVNLSKADGANIGDGTGVGTILNDDTVTASITKTISQVEGNTGNTNYDFTVTLDNAAATDVVIPWTFAHVDSEDEDFDAGITKSGKVTIPTGQLSAKIPSFAVLGENLVELDETFTVTLGTPETAGVELSADKVGTGTIQNDDSATIIITGPAATLEGNAGNMPVEFTVTLSNPSDVPVLVNFQTQDGTATVAGNDYSPTTGKIMFEAGKSGTIKIPVNILGDTSVEPNETFTMLLDTLDAGAPARNVSIQTASAPATITDDDAVSITIQSVSIEEGNAGTKNLKFSIALSNPVAGEVSVDLDTQDGTATAGVDYTATSKTITFPANSTTAIDFEVPIIGDNLVELDEAFTVLLSNLQSGAFTVNLPSGPITGTITNDDSAMVTLTPASQNEENAGTKNMVFTATLSNPVDIDFTVHFATSDGTATLVDNDYSETKQTLSFTKGGALTQTINVPIIGDTNIELDETFTATLSNVQASGRNVTAGNPVTGTIVDDDEDAPVANIADVAILEGNSGETLLVFTITLTKANPLADVLVEVSTADITALAGTDYTALVNEAVTIAKDSISKTVTVKLNGDTLIENDETFKLSITKIDGAKIGDGEAIGTIINDDTATATIDSITLAEGNSGTTNFDFTVTIDKTAAFDVVIPWTFSHIDSEDSDFGGGLTKSGKVTIPAGSTSAKITPSFPVNGDTTLETNEEFSVTLGTPENAAITLSGATIGEGTITNDDQVTVSINDVNDMEPTVGNSKNFDFTVTLSAAADVDVVVPWIFTNLTTVDADFGAGLTKTGKVTIPAGQTSAQISGVFPVAGDLLTEVNETFRVALTTPETTGAILSANAIGTGTIVDADTAVVASIANKAQAEGNTGTPAFDFTVTLDKASPVDVVIPWTFTNGTTLDTDFAAGLTKSGKVTIPANQTSAKISFAVVGDTVLEGDETFSVTLGTPETPNASVNANSKIGTGTINNDDQVTVTINSVNDVEPANGNTKNFDFTVTLSAAADIDVVVPWSFTNVTTADADFGAGLTKTGKVTIPAGSTSAKITAAFPVAGDALSETPETFTVTLIAPETAGAVLANNNTVGTGTINDVTTVVASIDNKTIAEGNSGTTAFDFTVTLDKVAAVDVVIPWTFAHVTTLDNDFGAGLTKSGKVTIPAGQLSAKITPTFPVNGDTLLEANETFTVTLGTPETANTIVSDTAKVGTGTINNDDQVTVSITSAVQQTEGNSGTKNFDFAVSIDQAAPIDVVVPYTFAHVTTNAADFTGLTTTGKVTIPAGQTSVKITPTLAVNGDTSFEADETFTVTLSTPETSGAVLNATAKVGTGAIQNDDSIVASINAVSKAEGNSGTTNFDFEVSLDQVAAVDVVIPWTFTHVTTADSDFSAGLTKSGKVTIPAGQTKATITPSFPVNGDTLVELDETFTVTLGTPETSNVTLSSTSKIGTGTVQNDDTATASIKAVTQTEGNSGNTNFDFSVTLDKAASVDVTIPWTFAHVTTKDNDFSGTLTKSGNVTIPAGQTSIKIPSFAVLGDTTVEADETFTVTLGTPDRTSVVLSATEKVGTGTVTNDDSATISIGSAKVIEPTSGTSTITLPITMSQPADVDVTVTYTLTNGSTSDPDFASLTKTGTVVIPAGQTSPATPLSFTVATDAIDEPDETFTVSLSNPTFAGGGARNVTIPTASATGTGTIQEDPGTGKLSGFAYVDGNNNGVKDAGEVGIPGVTITLTGTPTGGSAITLTAMTADDGSYSFTGLTSGKYEITETQPATMFDGVDVVGTQGGTLANDKITGIVLAAAEEGTGNNFGELGLLPQFVTKRLFLASTPAAAQTLRVLNGRAAELAGNQTLADSIFNATVPSVVSAGGAAAANNNAAAAEFVPENNSAAGESLPAANNSAGEFVPADSAALAAQQQAAASSAKTATTSAASTPSTAAAKKVTSTAEKTAAKTTASKTSAVKTAELKTKTVATKVTTPKSVAAKSTATTTSTSSKRTSVLQALRSDNSPNSSADALKLLAIDEALTREKKWR